MSPERWRRVEDLLHSTLSLGPEERMAYLERACAGDFALRREVECLLLALDQGQGLEAPGGGIAERSIAAGGGLTPGQRLSHFQIGSLLGAGGMGVVYLAEDLALGRKVALKLLPRQFTHNEARLRRFEQEARTASALNHPNIVTIHEISESEAGHFIVMELVEGHTLRHLAAGPVAISSLVHWGRQVARALAAAHAAGIVHRDVKPDNIMVRDDGYVKVVDFGLARLAAGQFAVRGSQLLTTDSHVVMGTIEYMSPEQARGEPVNQATDVFSLGIVLYILGSGIP
jgi:serine/threonine protein kinase